MEPTQEILTRMADSLVTMSTAADRLRVAVEQLQGSVTQLTALALRLERRLDDVPAE